MSSAAVPARSQARPRAGAGSRLIGLGLTHLLMVVLSAVMMAPFVTMLLTSLMTFSQAYTFPPDLNPDAIALRPFHLYLLNSLLVASAITAARLATCSLGAFAFARLQFPGRDTIFWIYLTTLMLPEHVTLIPLFFIMRDFGWIDRYQGLTIPFFVTAFGVFLLRQFFLTIPRELEEAAIIDGAGPFGLYSRIILPLAKPALATVAIFAFLSHWNAFQTALIYLNTMENYTIPIGLRFYLSTMGNAHWNYLMAATLIAIIPPIAIFFTCQRYFVQGAVLTGLKA
jgi:multiple sugar transport system permease protein